MADGRRDALWLGLAALLGFWWGSAWTPLFDLDEGAFSEATLEMIRSGNWLTTTLDGEPRTDKPPLTYWLQALSVLLLGNTEFAFRLPSMLCATLWMLALYHFVRERAEQAAAGRVAAAAVALSLMPGVIGHAATADALLNLLLALSFLDMHRWWERPDRNRLLRVYLWMGLGLLAKGPVAVALPAATSLLFFASRGELRRWFAAATDWRGWTVLLAVVLPWTLAVLDYDGGAFLRGFLLEHNLGRFGNTMEGHGGHWYYYLAAAPLVLLPFTGLLPAAFGGALARSRDPFAVHAVIAFLLTLLLFSLSATQLPHYLLYGCSGLFALFGLRHHRVRWRRAALLPAAAFTLLLIALPLALPRLSATAQRAHERGVLDAAVRSIGWPYALSAAAAATLLVAAFVLTRRAWPAALLSAALAQALMVWTAVVPVLASAQQAPVRDAAGIVAASGREAVRWRTYLPSFSVYRQAVTAQRLPQAGEYVLLRADRMDDLRRHQPEAEYQEHMRNGGILLLLRTR